MKSDGDEAGPERMLCNFAKAAMHSRHASHVHIRMLQMLTKGTIAGVS